MVPLEALFFLQQGQEDECLPLAESQASIGMAASAAEVFKATSIAYPSYEHPDIRKAIYHNAAALSHRIPAYILRVSLTGRFWEKIEECPEKKGTVPFFGARPGNRKRYDRNGRKERQRGFLPRRKHASPVPTGGPDPFLPHAVPKTCGKGT